MEVSGLHHHQEAALLLLHRAVHGREQDLPHLEDRVELGLLLLLQLLA